MNTLKITAYKADGTLFRSKMESEDDVPEFEMCHNSWWYLHGKLESFVGYDKGITTNCLSAGYSKFTIDWSEIQGNEVVDVLQDRERPVMHVDGIIPVEIEGVMKPCLGYFWTTDERTITWKGRAYPYWQQRGIVCLADDREGCKYAQKKYDERARML